jgi:hypothetical protein
MSEQKPDGKFVSIAKMVAVCVICIGTVYAIVLLFTA